jgi:polyketide cyclase/dehydrase/lipid transport protein
VRAQILVPAPPAAAAALWCDLRRWPAWVDGFGHVASVGPAWPAAGSRLLWDSHPGGRGRVVEEVEQHEPGRGLRLAIEDEKVRGTQHVAFTEHPEGATVTVVLEYAIKDRTPLTLLLDLLFVRRAMGDSLRRTLARFRVEARDDLSA